MKILVIGGYGNFGKRLVNSLVCHHDHDIVVAGRAPDRADGLRRSCLEAAGKAITSIRLDVFDPALETKLRDIDADIVVNASGPFQRQAGQDSYPLASACAAAGCHYVDLADDRRFVCGFTANLDRLAKKQGVTLVTGASTVPGLTAAVIDKYRPDFACLDRIDYAILPGNRSERGLATVASILSYSGRPFEMLLDGHWQRVFGWQDLRRIDLGPPLRRRWLGNCDIPDLELLPARYPELQTLRFQAGLEVTLLHLGLWLLSWMSRAGLVNDWSRFALPLTRMSDWFRFYGSDCGAMYADLAGVDHAGNRRRLRWQLVAENGSGPNIPTIAAELVISGLARGEYGPGAMPCVGLFQLDAFLRVARRWGIYVKEAEHV